MNRIVEVLSLIQYLDYRYQVPGITAVKKELGKTSLREAHTYKGPCNIVYICADIIMVKKRPSVIIIFSRFHMPIFFPGETTEGTV